MFIYRNPFQLVMSPDEPVAGDPPANTPPAPKDQGEEVRKAYDKLRKAESERDDFKRQLSEANTQLGDLERIRAENEQLRTSNGSLSDKVSTYELGESVGKAASEMGVQNPSRLTRLVDKSKCTDDAKTKEEIERVLNDFPELRGATPPSGGELRPNNGETPTGNEGMNQQIRSAAGVRATAP